MDAQFYYQSPERETACMLQDSVGARIDSRILVTGSSQYYVPFITITVFAPGEVQIWQQNHVYSSAHINAQTTGPGRYKICFSNPQDSRTDAFIDLVYFTMAHLRQKGSIQIPRGKQEDRDKEIAHSDQVDNVKIAIVSMSEFMQVISGSQRYLQKKLDYHSKVVEKACSKTLNYAALEVLVLFLVMGTQIVVITKMFAKGRVRNISVLSV